MSSATDEFRAARDFLLAHRTDYVTAYSKFRWPRPERFNFAFDWFDTVLAAERPNHTALRIIEPDGTDESYSFGRCRSDPIKSRDGCGERVCDVGCRSSSYSATRLSCGRSP